VLVKALERFLGVARQVAIIDAIVLAWVHLGAELIQVLEPLYREAGVGFRDGAVLGDVRRVRTPDRVKNADVGRHRLVGMPDDGDELGIGKFLQERLNCTGRLGGLGKERLIRAVGVELALETTAVVAH
jgi:hypothetical protein